MVLLEESDEHVAMSQVEIPKKSDGHQIKSDTHVETSQMDIKISQMDIKISEMDIKISQMHMLKQVRSTSK